MGSTARTSVMFEMLYVLLAGILLREKGYVLSSFLLVAKDKAFNVAETDATEQRVASLSVQLRQWSRLVWEAGETREATKPREPREARKPWVLLGPPGSSWGPGSSWILLGPPGRSWVPGSSWVLLGPLGSGSCSLLLAHPWASWVLLGPSGSSPLLQVDSL